MKGDTGQSISSLGKVPIEILPGKRHITWVLTVLLFTAEFQMEPLALNVGFGRASKSFCPLHGEVYGQTVFRHFPPSIRKYPPSFWDTNVIGHEEWNDEVHFGSKW